MSVQVESLRLPPTVKEALDEAVRRIVKIAKPEAIMLFGSHAEGRASLESDLDLMVIAETEDAGHLTEDLYEEMADLRRGRWREMPAFDILVLTPEQWRHESELPGLLVHHMHRRGVVVHVSDALRRRASLRRCSCYAF